MLYRIIAAAFIRFMQEFFLHKCCFLANLHVLNEVTSHIVSAANCKVGLITLEYQKRLIKELWYKLQF